MSAPPPLPGVLASLEPVLNHWGYLAVGGLVLLEDFGIPVPGETVLIVASVYAGAGRLNALGVALIAFAAAVLGDNIGYAIGHFGGHRLVERYGRYIFLTPARVARAEAFFTRHGGKIVIVARFIEGLRQANGIIAGLSRMPWRRFLAYNAIGAALWVGTWVTVGSVAGTHIGTIYAWVTRAGVWALIGLGLLIVALIARHMLRRRRERARAEREPSRGERGPDLGRPAPTHGGQEGTPREATAGGGERAAGADQTTHSAGAAVDRRDTADRSSAAAIDRSDRTDPSAGAAADREDSKDHPGEAAAPRGDRSFSPGGRPPVSGEPTRSEPPQG